MTVRTLGPGTVEQFRSAFLETDQPLAGWVRFNMLRNAENPNEVVCFGFFDGTVAELRQNAAGQGLSEQPARIAPFIESVGADALCEIVEDLTISASPR